MNTTLENIIHAFMRRRTGYTTVLGNIKDCGILTLSPDSKSIMNKDFPTKSIYSAAQDLRGLHTPIIPDNEVLCYVADNVISLINENKELKYKVKEVEDYGKLIREMYKNEAAENIRLSEKLYRASKDNKHLEKENENLKEEIAILREILLHVTIEENE